MRGGAALALCLALVPNLALAQADANPRIGPDIADLIHGIYCASPVNEVEEAPETASGIINLVDELPEMRFVQTVVPGALDIGFGVLVLGQPGITHETVTITITHPPYPDNGIEVERWVTDMNDLNYSLMGFTFDTPGEIVMGTWTFTAEAEGVELYHIAFEVVPPELLPNVLDDCFGTFIS